MKHMLASSLFLAFAPLAFAAPPKPLVTGIKKPESACVGLGKIFVTEIGESGKDGDGRVLLIENGEAKPFATGLDDPKGIAAVGDTLYVADKTKIWKIDSTGKAEVFVDEKAFPTPPLFLNDIAIEADKNSGTIYVSDSGNLKGKDSAIYAITMQNKKATTILDTKKMPKLQMVNGLLLSETGHVLFIDMMPGILYRLRLADGAVEKLADGMEGGDGLVWDNLGRLYISSWKQGKLWVIPKPGTAPILLAEGFGNAADICLSPDGKSILVPDMKEGTLVAVPIAIPGWAVDESPLPFEPKLAFPDLKYEGWQYETDDGKLQSVRPIVLTHVNDGSNRIFVALQHGIIYSFANDPKATEAKIFLDIKKRVKYADKTNEEGFLGLAFHPKYKENGEFFVFYTLNTDKMVNVVSRFRVSKDNPNKADPASEEVLLTFEKPYWNHDGGTVAFGPDGYLYITHGDGGLGGDPHGNGQKLSTLLGKILRIDVDHKDAGKNYAIPKDNPFVGKADVLPEIWAYGFRNIWRMAFDRGTGQLWAADVGQKIWEEIDIVVKGGNYGWSIREGTHPYGNNGTGPQAGMIEPVWEYHHDLGKSITGGLVYRGAKFPELVGCYLYADYVAGKIWALKYDAKAGRVMANHPLKDRAQPIMSFGEDEKGEIYLLTHSAAGNGIFTIAK